MFTQPGSKKPESKKSDSGSQTKKKQPKKTVETIDEKIAALDSMFHGSESDVKVKVTEAEAEAETVREFGQLSEIESQFRSRLMENVREAVVFVDPDFNITCWNRSAELTTGLAAQNMLGSEFTPSLVGLTKLDGSKVGDLQCPVTKAMESQKQTVQEFGLVGRSGREISVELNVVPVVYDRKCHGAVILLQDLSANTDLKRQLSELHSASVLDPLTRVSNRAEFERNLHEYARAHRATDSRCSIIICDIDYFKKVNDTYGHHIGDQALIAFAQMLKKFVRSRDIVARYGGEEFVILCANCDLKSAVERAEQIRLSLNRSPQQMLNGKTLSASFGVAELGPDEDITDFFVRADKALYSAKELGRNRVELSCEGPDCPAAPGDDVDKSNASGVSWRKLRARQLYCEEFRAATPMSLLTNKLRGYVTETKSQIRAWESDYFSITVLAVDPTNNYRKTHFQVDIEIVESPDENEDLPINYIRIAIFPPKPRLFRRVYEELHLRVAADIRRYLMLSDETSCVKQHVAAATTSGREED